MVGDVLDTVFGVVEGMTALLLLWDGSRILVTGRPTRRGRPVVVLRGMRDLTAIGLGELFWGLSLAIFAVTQTRASSPALVATADVIMFGGWTLALLRNRYAKATAATEATTAASAVGSGHEEPAPKSLLVVTERRRRRS